MSEWTEHKLGELADVQTGPFGSQLHASRYVEVGIPTIMPKDIGQRLDISTDSIAYITEEDAQRLEKHRVKPNDVVFSRRGDVEKCVFVTEEMDGWLCGTGCLKVSFFSDAKVFPRFMAYWFSTRESKHWLTSHAVGTTMPNLNSSILSNLPVELPPPPEQRAIAGVLSALDDKIDLLHRQNRTLESLAQALFRHWFIDGAEEDWEEVTVGEYTKINEISVGKDYAYSEIDYLDTGSITEGIIAGFQAYALVEAPSRARRLVKHDDVIISTVRPNQKHYGIVKNPQPNLVVSTGFCVISCDKIDPHFVYLLLTQADMTEYLHSVAEGSTSTYPSLKPSDIASVEFQLPPQKSLNDFSEIAHSIWEKIDQNFTQIRTLAALRDTLLPKLMSGEVRVRGEGVY